MSNVESECAAAPGEKPAKSHPVLQAGEVIFPSSSLMAGQREIIITHAGLRYRLRITANDKLILTK